MRERGGRRVFMDGVAMAEAGAPDENRVPNTGLIPLTLSLSFTLSLSLFFSLFHSLSLSLSLTLSLSLSVSLSLSLSLSLYSHPAILFVSQSAGCCSSLTRHGLTTEDSQPHAARKTGLLSAHL